MNKGDVILIPFPFTDLTGDKLRPAIVLISSKSDVTVCFITTQFQWRDKFDLKLSPSPINGIKKESIARVGKLATIDKSLVLGKIGKLESKQLSELNNSLRNILQLS